MAYLRSLDDQIQIHIQEGQNLLVGRLLKCDVVIEDGSVSSQHARLQLINQQLRVVDMGSTNGTRINYSVLQGAGYLLDGDTLEIGNVSFIVDGPGLSAPSEANPMVGLPDLHPLESSQKLSDTMLNIPVPSDEDLSEYEEGVHTALSPADMLPYAEEPPVPGEKIIEINPLLYGFALSLFLLLLAGAVLLLHLSHAFPPPSPAASAITTMEPLGVE